MRIVIIGMGYVGLPLAIEFGKKFNTVGFDIDSDRIGELNKGFDRTLEVDSHEFKDAKKLIFTKKPLGIINASYYIVTVPTPINKAKQPNLDPLRRASETVGRSIGIGGIVIFESTVYPGATEEVCIPIIEKISGLKFNVDFFAGYSPERINPGDKERRLPNILKITSGSTDEVAEKVDKLYNEIITAGTYKASSMKVAEAAKVIENTQRDVNIALVNELALIFNLIGIDTLEVLEAAGTKWNFLPFRPGLVGGHCLKPTAMVTMADGSLRQIKDIEIGDMVITHKGRPRKVVNTIKHHHEGLLYSIYAKGTYFPLETTCEHKVFASLWKRTPKTRVRYMEEPSMVESGNLITHHKYKDCHRLHQHSSAVGNEGCPKFARLLGLYLAEGSVDGRKGKSPKRTRLAFHEDEINLQNDVKYLCKELYDIDTYVRKPHPGECLIVEIGSKHVTSELLKYGGKLSWEKRLNPEIFSWSHECLKALWDGWFDGDGSYKNGRGVVVTVSEQLAHDMYRVGLMIGLSLSIRYSDIEDKRRAYYIHVLKHNYRNYNHRTVAIDRIDENHYDGLVYDLEVDEDHSFIADTFVVSNCISVDPYYLTYKAESLGYLPEVILAGRRTNDGMANYVAQSVVKLMIKKSILVNKAKVLILGITFKENCPDVRNSGAVNVVEELQSFGCDVSVYDSWADINEVNKEYGIKLISEIEGEYDAIVLTVGHQCFKEIDLKKFSHDSTVIYDIKHTLDRDIVDGRL